jgi:signal transduction histidine kinase
MKRLIGKLGQVFSPWPIRPLPLAILVTVLALLTNSAVLLAVALSEKRVFRVSDVLPIIPTSVVGFFFALIALMTFRYLGQRYARFYGWFYWLGAVVFWLALPAARFLTQGENTPEYWSEPRLLVGSFVGLLALYLTYNVSAGMANQKLEKEIELVQAAKTALEAQRRRVISAGEDAQKQVADFLHDRLQSDLVLLGLQMQRSMDRFGPDGKPVAQAFIEEIERIRQFDVRNISKQLAPELDGPSLRPAVGDLLERYEKVLKTTIDIAETGQLLQRIKLASYRIIEQAVLNASQNAAASQVDVKFTEFEGFVEIRVFNDGDPLPTNPLPGTGFAVFEDWTKEHRGNWEIRPSGTGTELFARLSKRAT